VADRKQAEQLAHVMQFLYSLGFDLDTVKRAADAWWQIKGAPLSGVTEGDLHTVGAHTPMDESKTK
jgi:hypothetical protein